MIEEAIMKRYKRMAICCSVVFQVFIILALLNRAEGWDWGVYGICTVLSMAWFAFICFPVTVIITALERIIE